MQNHKDTLQFDILVNGPEANNLRCIHSFLVMIIYIVLNSYNLLKVIRTYLQDTQNENAAER